MSLILGSRLMFRDLCYRGWERGLSDAKQLWWNVYSERNRQRRYYDLPALASVPRVEIQTANIKDEGRKGIVEGDAIKCTYIEGSQAETSLQSSYPYAAALIHQKKNKKNTHVGFRPRFNPVPEPYLPACGVVLKTLLSCIWQRKDRRTHVNNGQSQKRIFVCTINPKSQMPCVPD